MVPSATIRHKHHFPSSCAGSESNGVFAAGSTGPGGYQGVTGHFSDGSVSGVADKNGYIQPFNNGENHL